MPEQLLFYLVFLSQVLLISVFFPWRILSHMRYVLENYPPSEYPRLYPRSMPFYERAMDVYKRLNLIALLVGLALVVVGLVWPADEMLGWDTSAVLTLYLLLQFSPLLATSAAGMVFFSSKRRADSRKIRTAALRPRRLSDFISPTMIGIAVCVYVAFCAFVVYVNRFDYHWFGGYLNIVGITGMNLFFLAIILRNMYGKKVDPYQAHEDRMRQIGLTVQTMVFISIVGTLKIALDISLRMLGLESFLPTATTLYFQIVAFASLRAFRIDQVDFEVYREEPVAT